MTPYAKLVFLVVCAVLPLGGCTEADNHPGQPVQHRVAAFKKMLQSMEQMGMVVRERQEFKAADFLEHAHELKALAQEPWQYFTPNSNYPPTRAKPDLWQHQTNFAEFRNDLDESLAKLIAAAETGKMDMIAPAYTSVEDSCEACHQRFRKTLQ
ncbi:MAG: cytochrome c [Sulfuricella sp.]|nr:cytochrome c [Sulfuricella sp.]